MGKKRIKRFMILSLVICTFLMSSLTVFAVEDIPLESESVESDIILDSDEETDSDIDGETVSDITDDIEGDEDGGNDIVDDNGGDVVVDADSDGVTPVDETSLIPSEISEKLDTLSDTATSDNAILTEISARVQSIYEKLIEDSYFFSKDFSQYTVTEGLLLLIFIVLLAELFLKITANLLHWRMF